jgi:hypothetical protein
VALALDDPRWRRLRTAYGPATEVPGLLRALSAEPGEGNPAWDEVWSSLCHQGTLDEASYAALPHVVAIGAAAQAAERAGAPQRDLTLLWSFVGAVARSRVIARLPDDVGVAYRAADPLGQPRHAGGRSRDRRSAARETRRARDAMRRGDVRRRGGVRVPYARQGLRRATCADRATLARRRRASSAIAHDDPGGTPRALHAVHAPRLGG